MKTGLRPLFFTLNFVPLIVIYYVLNVVKNVSFNNLKILTLVFFNAKESQQVKFYKKHVLENISLKNS